MSDVVKISGSVFTPIFYFTLCGPGLGSQRSRKSFGSFDTGERFSDTQNE